MASAGPCRAVQEENGEQDTEDKARDTTGMGKKVHSTKAVTKAAVRTRVDGTARCRGPDGHERAKCGAGKNGA